jgi:hypothetical protein
MRISRHAKAVAFMVTPARRDATSRATGCKLRANHSETPRIGFVAWRSVGPMGRMVDTQTQH